MPKKIPDPISQVLPDWKKKFNIFDEETSNRLKNIIAEQEGKILTSCWNCNLLIEEDKLVKNETLGLTICPRCEHAWFQEEYTKINFKKSEWQFAQNEENGIGSSDFMIETVISLANHINQNRQINVFGNNEPIEFTPSITVSGLVPIDHPISIDTPQVTVSGPVYSVLWPVRHLNVIMGSETEESNNETENSNESTQRTPDETK